MKRYFYRKMNSWNKGLPAETSVTFGLRDANVTSPAVTVLTCNPPMSTAGSGLDPAPRLDQLPSATPVTGLTLVDTANLSLTTVKPLRFVIILSVGTGVDYFRRDTFDLLVLLVQGNDESCLAILNNFYNDGIKWHDVACHHVKPFVCEDSDELLNFVRSRNPGLRLWNP